jgi:hypothetical protein
MIPRSAGAIHGMQPDICILLTYGSTTTLGINPLPCPWAPPWGSPAAQNRLLSAPRSPPRRFWRRTGVRWRGRRSASQNGSPAALPGGPLARPKRRLPTHEQGPTTALIKLSSAGSAWVRGPDPPVIFFVRGWALCSRYQTECGVPATVPWKCEVMRGKVGYARTPDIHVFFFLLTS